MSLLVPFLSVLLLVGVHAQHEVHFNNSYNCTTGCYINNPAIYIGNVLPNITDAVFFNVTSVDAHLIAPSNSTFNVSSLSILNTALLIEANAIVEVVEELSFQNVIVHVNETGVLVGLEASFEGVTISSSGYIRISEAEFSQSAIFGINGSRFHFFTFELENGEIEIDAGANFTVYEESDFDHSKLHFEIAPYLGEVEFESVEANFPVGFYAENQYIISSSNFSAYFPDALSNVSFILAGKNNLTVSNLNCNSDKFKINSTGTPFITFNVNNNAAFDGNITVPGDIVVQSNSSINFNGTITLSGGITATAASSTHIRTAGTLTVGTGISLTGANQNESSVFAIFRESNSFTVNNAVINAPFVKLENFELFSHTGTTIINCNIINNGSIHIFESSSVIIEGNYTQLPNSTLGVYNLDDTRNRLPNLYVNGHAQVDGHIKYNTSETRKKFKATVLISEGLTGNFSTSEFFGDITEFNPEIEYTADSVIISMNPDQVPSWKGLYWWVWLLIGVGAVTVLVALIIVIRVVRKRGKYEPVQGNYN